MRKNMIILSAILVVISFLLPHCSKSTDPDPDPHRTPADMTLSEKKVASSMNTFGFKLFSEINRQTGDDSNIFISPLSVSYAIGMTLNGANGVTKNEITTALEHTDLSEQERNKAYHDLTQLLTLLDPKVTMEIANAIWYRLGLDVENAFIETNREYFRAQVNEMDFTCPGNS